MGGQERMGTYVLTCFGLMVPSVDARGLIEDGDCVGHAVSGEGGGGGVERGRLVLQDRQHLWALAGPAELAGQRLVQVELHGYGTAAVEVQVVLAAQLAVLQQGRLAGRALLFKVTAGRAKHEMSHHKSCQSFKSI